ncbi:MAG: ferredoxin [Acidimicrobiia bacterium]
MADEPGYRIVVDRETCMGSGVCCVYASNTFAVDDEALVVVIDPNGDPLDHIRSAASGCPTNSITVVDEP